LGSSKYNNKRNNHAQLSQCSDYFFNKKNGIDQYCVLTDNDKKCIKKNTMIKIWYIVYP